MKKQIISKFSEKEAQVSKYVTFADSFLVILCIILILVIVFIINT